MTDLKDKMYNYEVAPPSQSWQIIAHSLDEVTNNNMHSLQKRNKKFYYSLAAAAVTILFFTMAIRLSSVTGNINKEGTAQLANGLNTDENNLTSQPALDDNEGNIIAEAGAKKYILICGTQGQPIKISSKVASLIVSSDDQDPPNPVWSEKVKKWKEIMKANTLVPTTGNFLDIVELTHTLRMSNP